MSKIKFIILYICVCVSLKSQVNLVIDPSMENYLSCPTPSTANEGCYTWHALDSINNTINATISCTPLYLNVCSISTDNSCPNNYTTGLSFQYPRTGDGMYGMEFYLLPSQNPLYNRDYLRGRIRQLINGKQYCGKYYVSLFNTQYYAIDRFGAYLDNGALDANNECLPIVITPTWENAAFNYINDTLGWQKVQNTFIANGNESYITLGNFYNDANTHKVVFNTSSMRFGEAYYYVDDVSIIATDITAYAGSDATICITDSIHLGRPQEVGLECLWYKPTIATPFASTSDIWFKPTQTGTYTFMQRMDNCAITWDTVNITVIQDCSLLLPTKEIPNVFTPDGDGVNDVFSFTFSGALTNFSLYNRWGNMIQTTNNQSHTTMLWDGRTTSGEACSEGVYFYTLEYKDSKGDVIKKNGYVSLLR